MKEKPQRKPADASEQHRVVGKIPTGDFDTELQSQPRPETPQSEHSEERVEGLEGVRTGRGVPATPKSPRMPTPEPDTELLPEDAIVAMRRSGGFRFTSKRVVVYRDGRVEIQDDSPYARGERSRTLKLSDRQLAELYRLLDGADLPGLPATSGRQSPDASAYEIAARLRQTDYAVEAFEGSVPEQLKPLIQFLARFMRGAGGAG